MNYTPYTSTWTWPSKYAMNCFIHQHQFGYDFPFVFPWSYSHSLKSLLHQLWIKFILILLEKMQWLWMVSLQAFLQNVTMFPQLILLFWFSLLTQPYLKGQLIWKCPFGVFKKTNKIFVKISALAPKKKSNKKKKKKE